MFIIIVICTDLVYSGSDLNFRHIWTRERRWRDLLWSRTQHQFLRPIVHTGNEFRHL